MAAPKYGSEQYVKQFFTDDAVDPRPTAWEIALHSGNPGAGDDNEISGGDYARQTASFVAADAGSHWEASTIADVIFPAAVSGQSYMVTHYTVRDADSGECLATGQLPVGVLVEHGGSTGFISFPAGNIKVRGV